jgi:hypothetical protein
MPESAIELARIAHEDAGRGISQNFDTLHSTLALSGGALAALLALLGAGQLFANRITQTGTVLSPDLAHLPKLSSVSLLVLALAFPLFLRLFMRALLAMVALYRFVRVQAASWAFLSGADTDEKRFLHVYDELVTKWHSTMRFSAVLKRTLTYIFFWIFFVSIGSLIWAFITATGATARIVAVLVILIGICWEIYQLVDSWDGYFTLADKVARGPDHPKKRWSTKARSVMEQLQQ